MQKGHVTRATIIARAYDMAARIGFEPLSLADLAAETGMSKSGLYAHFRSKEALQQAVLELAVERFSASVVAPALRRPRGTERLRALFDGYLGWINASAGSGRCLFMALGQEYRDRPGPIRDALVQVTKDWHSTIARVAADAIEDGAFAADVEPRQVAFEIVGIGMSYQQSLKLLDRADAEALARRAFESLLERGRAAMPRDTTPDMARG
ncbi:TetR family transcriptional regulator [Cupriavidus gilardii J11]|uniref:TetR family transcriptional regulator n=1 Tax=Cupriavidus gilardii J11 TaxID=936133 RepID=A0A562BM78_9BURK|nr:TetR/AcrR family transcriptional regulator [Cupriavidus gilardii]TWG85983.1 TetR family transcriptional regulator [Cupriavidus gilardii J11]